MQSAKDYYTQKITHYQNAIDSINLLLTYDNNISYDDIRFLFDDNMNIEYACSPRIKSAGFTYLQKCVTLTNKYYKINNYLAEYLTKNKDSINKVNKKGWNALHLAARNLNTKSSYKTVEILINAGANLNLQNNVGSTALHLAALYSKCASTEETVEILINAGADLNIKNNVGCTALYLAALYSKYTSTEKTVKILINTSTIKTYFNA